MTEKMSKMVQARITQSVDGKLTLRLYLNSQDREDFVLEKGFLPANVFSDMFVVDTIKKSKLLSYTPNKDDGKEHDATDDYEQTEERERDYDAEMDAKREMEAEMQYEEEPPEEPYDSEDSVPEFEERECNDGQ